jgi:hypothetical protein
VNFDKAISFSVPNDLMNFIMLLHWYNAKICYHFERTRLQLTEFDKLHQGCFKLANYVYMITFNLYASNDHKLHAKLVLQLAHAPSKALKIICQCKLLGC